MITAAEYRALAEESLEWAAKATTANEREAYIKFAEIWLQSALRSERLAKEPIAGAETRVGTAALSTMAQVHPS